MSLFGAYDRTWLASEDLFASSGCGDADRITILADSDQRTRESGKALAEGMFPGCGLEVHALPEGRNDTLFHSMSGGVGLADPALEAAAIRGRIGGNVNNLTQAYHSQLAVLDRVLAACGQTSAEDHKRISIFDIPARLAVDTGRHRLEMRGPLNTASSLTEDLLLEYTDGMPIAHVGWGCIDGASLRTLMQLHSAAEDLKDRTPVVAHTEASNLLDQILRALEQQVTGKPVASAPGKPGDRMLILVGHDTNIATVSGTLNLDWILDARRNDTPPGGALVFELWRSATGVWSLRVYFTAQTLEQMRDSQVLTMKNPPVRVPVFVPGCSTADLSCPFKAFAAVVQRAIVQPLPVSRTSP